MSDESINEYLPRDKHDFERVNDLENLSKDEIVLMLPDLMEWIQDMNWPIAKEVAEILLTFPNEIVPLIKEVFKTNDNVWKYWCLLVLVKRLPRNYKKLMIEDLNRLISRPTKGEKIEELDELAAEILIMTE